MPAQMLAAGAVAVDQAISPGKQCTYLAVYRKEQLTHGHQAKKSEQ